MHRYFGGSGSTEDNPNVSRCTQKSISNLGLLYCTLMCDSGHDFAQTYTLSVFGSSGNRQKKEAFVFSARKLPLKQNSAILVNRPAIVSQQKTVPWAFLNCPSFFARS